AALRSHTTFIICSSWRVKIMHSRSFFIVPPRWMLSTPERAPNTASVYVSSTIPAFSYFQLGAQIRAVSGCGGHEPAAVQQPSATALPARCTSLPRNLLPYQRQTVKLRD